MDIVTKVMVSFSMIYLIILTLVPAMFASAYAITAPHKIQNMLNIKNDISPEEFLDTLGKAEKSYLFLSMTPLLLAPLLAFSDLPRGGLYCFIMVILACISIVFRNKFIRHKRLVIFESTVELILYCDVLRSGVVSIWG